MMRALLWDEFCKSAQEAAASMSKCELLGLCFSPFFGDS